MARRTTTQAIDELTEKVAGLSNEVGGMHEVVYGVSDRMSELRTIPVRLTAIETHMEGLLAERREVDEFINGNGKDGAKVRIDRLEQNRRMWNGGFMAVLTPTISSVVGAVIATLIALSGCVFQPSPPQATAGALNATYEARATASQEAAWIQSMTGSPSSPDTLSVPMDRYTPIISPPPSATQVPTPTPDLPVEVSPAPTGAGPQEVGEPLNCFPQPGGFCKESGVFTARGGNRVRSCASIACPYSRTLTAGEVVITGGYAQGNPGELWVCLEISEDDTPAHAQNCDGAIAWRFPNGYYGKYEVTK